VTSTVYSVELLQKNVDYTEINLKQYRSLLKCFLGDDIFPELIFKNTNNLLLSVTNIKDLNKLNFIDYILLLLQIRSISIGDIVFLNLLENDKQYKVELSLSEVFTTILDSIPAQLQESITIEDWTIKLKIPTIEELLTTDLQTSSIDIFIETIHTKNLNINLSDLSSEKKSQIIKHIPIKIVLVLNKIIQNILKEFEQINLLEPITIRFESVKTLPLIPNLEILAFIIKLIYNTNLESLYESIFVLSKAANISPSYLDNCSPGEFYLYVKKLEEYNAARSKNNNTEGSNELPISEAGEDQFTL
jgi:hypothetical protein